LYVGLEGFQNFTAPSMPRNPADAVAVSRQLRDGVFVEDVPLCLCEEVHFELCK